MEQVGPPCYTHGQLLTLPELLCFGIYEMEIGKPFPVSSLSPTKHRLGGLDKRTPRPGHRLCCQNVISPPL